MTPRAHPPAHEASSASTTGGRIAQLSIAAPSAYYAVYTQGGKPPEIVYTVSGVSA